VPAPPSWDQPSIGGQHIRVADHDLRRPNGTVTRSHAGCRPLLHEDFVDPRAQHDVATQFLEKLDERTYQHVHATPHIVHPTHLLEVWHDGVDARRLEWVSPDEQRMKAEEHAQARITEITGHQAIHRAICSQPYQVRQDRKHAGPAAEVVGPEILEGALVESRGVAEKTGECVARSGLETLEL
jgi:hypothetical protein